jgi:uncharacterized CHY-type Zn-finger protein
MAAALTREGAEARMAQVKARYGITAPTQLGECFKCHQVVDKYSFLCQKHSIQLRKKHGWFGDKVKKKGYKQDGTRDYKVPFMSAKDRKARRQKHLETVIAKEQKLLEQGEVLPATTPVFYDDYKEPLRETPDGYGYLGVVATDESRNFIQCHTCGKFYKSLSSHLPVHKTTIADYKKEYGLAVKTALIGESTREMRIKARELRIAEGKDRGLPEHLKRYYQEIDDETRKTVATRRAKNSWSLERQNKLGLCPDQIVEKLTDLVKIMGRVPSQDEFKEHYKFRYISSIKYHFGDWASYVAAAGLKTTQQALDEATSPERLIHYLQEFYQKYQRVPMNSDFKRGIVVARYHYFKQFGSLNAARVEANLPAVIPMPGHRYMLIQPENFVEYQQLRDQVLNKRSRRKVGRTFFDQQVVEEATP